MTKKSWKRSSTADTIKEMGYFSMDAVSAGDGRYSAILWVKPNEVNKAAKAIKSA